MANLHLIDLSNKKLELDKIFDSVINKIPDLCMPQSYRWAKEDDFFGQTKSLELEPFRKQDYFDKYISPIQSQLAHQSEQSSASTSKADFSRKPKQPELKLELEKLEELWVKQVRNKFELDLRRKKLLRELLKRRYSRLSVGVKLISNQCRYDSRLGFDKLFISMPKPNYPYANPMPGCMMTSENVDNLREIIVATTDVEWKMLTPVRPDNEYEEKFFDKLINLHRYRHKARLECGYYDINRTVPFKHVRHNYLLNSNLSSPTTELLQVQVDSSTKSPSDTVQEERSQTKEKQRELLLEVEIPKLTLSSDGRLDELIMDNRSANSHHRRSSRASPRPSIVLEKRPTLMQKNRLDDERVEDRVEAIVNQLMITSLNV